MSSQAYSFALALLAASGIAGLHGELVRGEEAMPMSGLEVEFWWAGDRSAAVERLMFSSEDRAGETKAWKAQTRRINLGDIPGLEDLLDSEAGPGRRHIAVLSGEECRTLYDVRKAAGIGLEAP